MYLTADIAVEGAAYSYDKAYSYLVPAPLSVSPGQRVRIPFGRGNRKRLGLVLAVREVAVRERLKPLLEVVDASPILDGEGLLLLRYLREQTFCTWFDALRLLVPSGLGIVYRTYYSAGNLPPLTLLTPEEQELVEYLRGYKKPVEAARLEKRFGAEIRPSLPRLAEQGVLLRSEGRAQRVRDERLVMARLVEDWRPEPLSPKQKLVFSFLTENGSASLKEVCYYTASTRAVCDALVKKGAVQYYDQPVLRDPFGAVAEATEAHADLSPAQQRAYDALAPMLEEREPKPALLHGVTGSGKTEIYLQLIARVLDKGKKALVLVPEISLTAQVVERFHRRFGDRVALLHSSLSLGERMDQWKRIRAGGADIVVGTRSAVFALLPDIGLIVMDEEQEHTYRSEQSPRFHAREVAKLRATHHGALLLLSSATPAVESYHNAGEGRYRLVELAERYGGATLPDVYVVDLREAANLSGSQWISAVLQAELRATLDRGEQAILLLNRRGYSTVIKCAACGVVADCPNCSVALTYHTANQSLMCHYCGHTQPLISRCGHCGGENIRYAGAGTQKLAEELTQSFPGARVLRVDMDTTMAKFSHQEHFGAFLRREYDIIVGTQMVAKGLDFPGVTLVGVLNADQSLFGGDFRSYERSFSLLTQVVGRGGRGTLRGRAVIQTYSPDHPVIKLAAMQDYPAFFADEIVSRRIHLYPPYCVMAAIGFVGEDLEAVTRGCTAFVNRFRALAPERCPRQPLRLLGPVPAEILKAAGKYRYRLILKCKNNHATRALLAELLEWFGREAEQVHAFVDMYSDRI